MINSGSCEYSYAINLSLSCCARCIIVVSCYGLITYGLSKYDEYVEIYYECITAVDAGNKKGSDAPFSKSDG